MTENEPSRIQELMAGFVMGNLGPEEAEEFHKMLARDPSLIDDSDLLQEILECLPYGLPEEEPPPQLRDRILEQADHSQQRRNRSPRFKTIAGAIAALLVLALGIDNYRLRQTSSQLVSRQDLAKETGTIAIAPGVILANQWYGLSELTDDHLKVTKQAGSPVAVPKIIVKQLAERFDRELDLALPLTQLNHDELELLGGSLCSLVKTKGVRLTYKIEGDRTLSFYQLVRPKTATYPHPGSSRLYIERRDRPAIVLWEDEQFLYALVADESRDRLDRWANERNPI